MDCGERDREEDEHRMSWSLHRPVESFVTKIECSGDVLTYDAVRARAARQGNTGDSLRCANSSRQGVWCGDGPGAPCAAEELRLESYCSCEHEERGAGRAVREG